MTLKMVQKHGEGGSIESLRAEWRGGDYDTKNGAKAWRGGFNGELKDWMEGGGLKGCRFFLFHVTKQFELKCLSLEKPGHALKQNNVFN